jgi:hypothetical protein
MDRMTALKARCADCHILVPVADLELCDCCGGCGDILVCRDKDACYKRAVQSITANG